MPGGAGAVNSNINSPLGPDTTTWGVRYNQQYHGQAPPPLPPRPASTGERPYSHAQTPVGSSPSPYIATTQSPPPPPPAVDHHYQAQWAPSSAAAPPLQPSNNIPPPPPPVPLAYQNEKLQQSNLAWQQPPQPTYSDHPPTHHYDPQVSQPPPVPHAGPLTAVSPPHNTPAPPMVRPTPPTQPPPSTVYHQPPPTLAPLVTSPVAPSAASALGFGGPSDWEHFGPVAGDVDDLDAFHQRTPTQVPPPRPAANATSVHPTVVALPEVPHTNQAPAVSPVISSPSTIYKSQAPLHPQRADTADSMASTVSSEGPSDSIDGVIEAWTQPFSRREDKSPGGRNAQASMENEDRLPHVISQQQPFGVAKHKSNSPATLKEPRSKVEESSLIDSSTTKKAESTTVPTKYLDPYEDLDPWSKSSLARYVTMLRKEAVADSDEDRYKLFTAFMGKETKLREVLYNIEHESGKEQKPESASQAVAGSTHITERSDSATPSVQTVNPPISSSNEIQIKVTSEESRPVSNQPAVSPSSASTSGSTDPVVPSFNGVSHKETLEPLTSNPPQPIYTPFRYTEGPQRGSDHLTFDRPAYQAYSALRQASVESGRVMSNGPSSSTPTPRSDTPSVVPARNEHDETFIGLIREKSVAYKKKPLRKASPPPPLPGSLGNPRTSGPLNELRSLVSTPVAKQSESFWNIATRKDLEKYNNDFTYIQDAVGVWEKEAKERRTEIERGRAQRQENSETHIDTMFNDKSIGYADINVLEEEFRQTEARVQLEEERKELDDYITNLFTPLDNRLKGEISKLSAHYETILSQLDHESTRTKESTADKFHVSHTMLTVNDIYKKLEARYQKRLEIALDREQRRKKAERRPLVFMGSSPALKQLDADFDRMEKQNLLEAAKDRDERANRLMDSFDDAIMRGLGENQSTIDDIAPKLKKLDGKALKSSGLSDLEIEQVLKSVATLVESLRTDSESILHYFGVADMSLNDADYSVSVAEARYSNADEDVFHRLENEKQKEDGRIQSDLTSKLNSVRKGPAEIIAQTNDLLRAIGKTPETEPPALLEPPSHRTETPPVEALLTGPRPRTATLSKPPAEDPEHQERLKRALEEAKKRNAARVTG
ncbi:hypothetical protein ASPZODRAFT_75221 [Penicilliopsis zonata CBS 506.65]|uniref:Uncharacterized protein n=1 Tax=Penicilliopsis zonata CBS 506.65 TaxID=1073090 RepID=A0A1L9S706_9EURO|nr:hypothetical protein ASPZODRAFT_75221 [Penicilliopsis zonata CBS 506.65]OJJ42934.1 hypothetical protein ASPZODRAFT_75221 [Penicilliopsis zonata CBS 506.65]